MYIKIEATTSSRKPNRLRFVDTLGGDESHYDLLSKLRAEVVVILPPWHRLEPQSVSLMMLAARHTFLNSQ